MGKMAKRALITGITGQDGPFLAKLLLEKKYAVMGVIRGYSTSSLKNLDKLGISSLVQTEICDLMDLSSVIGLIKRCRPDEIYNLSAQSSVSLSFQEPIGTISYNTISVLNLLEAIRVIDDKNIRIYQASSSDIFGNVEQLPINIDTPIKPVSPYAVSKAAAHFSIATYRKAYGIFTVSGVLFNHESELRNKTFFVKKVISEAVDIYLGTRDVLIVGNLDIYRDFGYAPAYVEAMWMMLQADAPKDYLICSGEPTKLGDIVEFLFHKLGIDPKRIVVDKQLYRPSEIKTIYGDCSFAKQELGWKYDQNFMSVLEILLKHELQGRKVNN